MGQGLHGAQAGALGVQEWPPPARAELQVPVLNSGPRSCIGTDLGLSNMKITAAAVMYNFKVELVQGQTVMPQSSVILHTENGMMVRLKRRVAA
jgi:cytochrome P450